MESLAKILYSQIPKITAAAGVPALSHSRSFAASATAIQQPPPQQQQSPSNGRTECNFEELNKLLRSYEQVSLVDVRSHDELAQCGSIPGAIHIPLQLVKEALQMSEDVFVGQFFQRKPTKKDRNLIFFARGPNASSAAVEIAHKLGFRGSRQYSGGWEDYCKRMGLPLKKDQPKPVSSATSPSYVGSSYNANSFGTNRYYLN